MQDARHKYTTKYNIQSQKARNIGYHRPLGFCFTLMASTGLEGHFEHAMVEHIQQEMIIRQRGELWNTLKNLRTHFASCEAVPPYCVFTNKALGSIVMRLPSTMIELRQCYGIGEQKCEKYGVDVLREVEAFVARNPNPTPIRQDLINRLHDSNARWRADC